MKHLLLEIVEATESAAIAASKYIGSGDKIKIDEVATEAMRNRLNNTPFVGQIAIGEGIKDKSPGLYKGEYVGSRRNEQNCNFALAVDPVDGTTQTAKGGYEAVSVIAVGGYNCLLDTEVYYMDKLAVGKDALDAISKIGMSISLRNSITDNLGIIRFALSKKQITVCMLDRPRHQELAQQIRSCGHCIKFIQDCDVSGAIAAALPESGIDVFVGIGGAPEGVIAAAALKCLGGYFEGMLVDNKNYKPIDGKIYSQEELAKGDVMFAATGITNGSLLEGVRTEGKGYTTHSLLMESATKSFKRVKSYYE